MAGHRYVPLFWRLFIPNATVLAGASVILMVQPANGRVVALAGGLAVMLAVNLVLMRRAFAPLTRLTRLMRRVDPLRPGQRVPVLGAESEVTVLGEAFNEMLDRLETERRESGRRALTERESERRHLAAELHDEIGQNLTALVLQLERLTARAPAELEGEAAAARDAALAAIDQVRTVARRLRPEALDALGLVPALTNLVERLSERTRVPIERKLERELPPLSSDAELVIYRVAQESLTNAMRHAEPTELELALRATGECVVLTVRDDGAGFEPDAVAEGGIRSMRERAVLIGAELHVEPSSAGTRVRLEVPLPA